MSTGSRHRLHNDGMPAPHPQTNDRGVLQVDSPPTSTTGRVRRTPVALVVGLSALAVMVIAGGERLRTNAGTASHAGVRSAAPPTSITVDWAASVLDEAEQVAERLVAMVNGGNSELVIELLSRRLPADGLGSSQWPLIHDDVGWWDGSDAGALWNESRISDFVRYSRTMPGSALVSSCRGRFVDTSSPRVIVDCDYSAFGGIRGLIGDGNDLDQGIMRVTIERGLVVDVQRMPDLTDAAWATLGAWAAESQPDVFEAVFGTLDGTPTLRPVYTAAAALQQIDVATSYARAAGLPPFPVG